MTSRGQCGPLELWELPSAGVTPDTYVWCKGMADWTRASEVADICRYYRQRLGGVAPLGGQEQVPAVPDGAAWDPSQPVKDNPDAGADGDKRNGRHTAFTRFPGMTPEELPGLPEDDVDIDSRPPGMLVAAILVTLACFPVTGFIAIYNAVMSQRAWTASEHCGDPVQAREYRRQAHDAARNVRMWIGISFFLGMGFWASVVFFQS